MEVKKAEINIVNKDIELLHIVMAKTQMKKKRVAFAILLSSMKAYLSVVLCNTITTRNLTFYDVSFPSQKLKITSYNTLCDDKSTKIHSSQNVCCKIYSLMIFFVFIIILL